MPTTAIKCVAPVGIPPRYSLITTTPIHSGNIVSLTPEFIINENPVVGNSLNRSLPSAPLQTMPSSSWKRPAVERLAGLIALGAVVDPNASGVDTL